MSRGTVLKCWLFLCCVTVSRQLSITELQVPAAVEAGGDVELKCRFKLSEKSQERPIVKWWSIHKDNRKPLYQRIEGDKPSYVSHVELKPGELDTIVLKSVSPSDSGTYECDVSDDDDGRAEDRKHHDLVVYTSGSGPQLNVSLIEDAVDADEVRIECQASGVAPAPDLLLKVNSIEKNVSKIISGPDDRGLYTILGNATVGLYEVDGAPITCELLFENPAVAHQPYAVTVDYVSGLATSTPAEDAMEVDANTEAEPLEGTGHGWHSGASWLLLVATPALAAALR